MSLQCFFCSDNLPNHNVPNSDTCFERTLNHDLTHSLPSIFPWITPDLAGDLIPGSFCTKCSVALVNGIWKLQKIKELKSELETIKNDLEYTLWGSREQLQGAEAVDNLERVDLKDIALKKRLKFRHVENGRLFFRGQRIIGPRLKFPNSGQTTADHTRHKYGLKNRAQKGHKNAELEPNQIRDIALKMTESNPRAPDPGTPPEPAEEFILPDQSPPEEPGVDQVFEPKVKIDPEPQEISMPEVDANKRSKRPRKTPHKLLVDLDLDPLLEEPPLSCGIFVERDPSVVEESLKSECLKRKSIVLVRRVPSKVVIEEYEREESDWLDKLKVSQICIDIHSTTQPRLQHERRTHNKADALQCHICPLTCPNRHQFSDHLATHSEEKNWKCPDCGMAFKLKNYLKTHQRRNCKSKKRASNEPEETGS